MTKFFLSNTGNILVADEGVNFFMTPTGVFIRMVGSNEYNFLAENAPEIFFRKQPKIPSIPKWKFLWKTQDVDQRDFVSRLSSNGGRYSFTENCNFFVRLNGGKAEYCCLVKKETSSDFGCNDDGESLRKSASFDIIGVEGNWGYTSDLFGDKDGELALDQVACRVKFEDVVYAANAEHTSNYDDNGHYLGKSIFIKEDLSIETKAERLKKIEEIIGFSPFAEEKKMRRRDNR